MFLTTNIDRQILTTFIASEQSLHPRIFCRRWFGLEDIKENGKPRYTEEQILLLESEHGYREKCIKLIAKILKIKPNTIQRWGKGVEFNKIPPDKKQQYETYLGYIDLLRLLSMGLTRQNKTLLIDILQSSKSFSHVNKRESRNKFWQQEFRDKSIHQKPNNQKKFAIY